MAGLYENSWCVSKFYEKDKLRIFSITNIPENELLFKENVIREDDIFLVLLC